MGVVVNLRDYERIHDGCIVARYRHKVTGQVVSQRKRRPARAVPDVCSWHESVPCDDHPKRWTRCGS